MADNIYRPQVAPVRATDTLPFATPETYGAGIGEALSGLGHTASRGEVQKAAQETQRERDFQASAATLELVKIQEEVARRALEAQAEAGPGGDGYAAMIEQEIADRETRLLGSIGDEKVRRAISERLASWKSDALLGAEAWERGQAAKLAVTNHQETTNIRANRVTRMDHVGFVAEVAAHKEDVGLLEFVPENVRAALDREGVAELSVSWIGSRPPEERLQLLDSGLFDQLDPGTVKELKNEARVDLRRAQLETEAQSRVAKAEAKDALDGFLRELGDGIPKSDADVAAMEKLADEWGFDKEVYNLGKARVQGHANREYERATPPQIDAEIKRLDTVIARAGDKARREDVWRRDHLAGLRDRRAESIASDPASFGAQLGMEWPELDFGDPASVASRRSAAEAVAAASHTPARYLSEAEAEQVKANMDSVAGQRAAVDLARRFGGRAGASVMRQLSPGDPLLLHATGLPSAFVGPVLAGRDLLAKKVVKLPSDWGGSYSESIGPAMALLAPELQAGVRQAAESLYAYYAQRGGLREDELSASLLSRVIGDALGARGSGRERKGGIGNWNGAPVVLPTTMTQEEFGRRLANIRNTDAVFSDGESPISGRQLRERFTPVAVRDGVYAFVFDRGGYAQTRDGKRWEITLSKIAPQSARPAEAEPLSTMGVAPEHVPAKMR